MRERGGGLASSGGSFSPINVACFVCFGQAGAVSTHPNAADEVMVRLLCFLSLSKSMAAQA